MSKVGLGTTIVLALPFISAVLDALLSYFLRQFGGGFRVGLIALAALMLAALIGGVARVRLRDRWLALLLGMFLSMLFGAALVDGLGTTRAVQAAGCIVYFMCGYVFFRWIKDVRVVQWVFLLTSGLYLGVCLLALSRLWPGIFPVVDMYLLKDGVVVGRPEVMTDQNFQLFYLIPAALGLIIARTKPAVAMFLGLVIASAYVLAQLGTRSGTLVLGGLIALGFAACIRNPALGRWKAWAVPVLLVGGLILMLPRIIVELDLLLYRFGDTGVQGAAGRLASTAYLFERIGYISWWIPRGTAEFFARTGQMPHSNATAFFLDAGLIGLALWVAIVVVPAVQLGTRVFRGGLDPVAAAVGCGGLAVLVLQLSLYAITASQVWVWAGAVVGVLERLRMTPSQSAIRGSRDSAVAGQPVAE